MISEATRPVPRSLPGPRTTAGKAIVRRNALRHGLCANLATVQDAGAFRRLHRALVRDLAPSNALEIQLVHRIAVCCWRLQRAACADAAIAGLAVSAVVPQRQAVQAWIETINRAWTTRAYIERKDPIGRAELEQRGELTPDATWYRFVRNGLVHLDRSRDLEMNASGPAMTAMIVMIDDLVGRLKSAPAVGAREAEQLAWLLGEPAREFPYDDPELSATPIPPRTPLVVKILGIAAVPPPARRCEEVESTACCRTTSLRQMRQVCEHPWVESQDDLARTAAALPPATDLDRIVRYEAHAERSLQRSLDLFG